MNIATLRYLSQPTVSDIFKKILRSRLLSFYQLEKKGINKEELIEVLAKLEELGLIIRKRASFTELDKYFLTRNALEFEKQLNLVLYPSLL